MFSGSGQRHPFQQVVNDQSRANTFGFSLVAEQNPMAQNVSRHTMDIFRSDIIAVV